MSEFGAFGSLGLSSCVLDAFGGYLGVNMWNSRIVGSGDIFAIDANCGNCANLCRKLAFRDFCGARRIQSAGRTLRTLRVGLRGWPPAGAGRESEPR
jgi:hypothetical protein